MREKGLTDVHRRYVGTVTTKPDQLFYTEVYKLWQDRLKDLPDGAVLHYTIQPVGSQAAKYGQEQGGTIMGLQAVPQVCKFPHPSFETVLIPITHRVGFHRRMALQCRRHSRQRRRGRHG